MSRKTSILLATVALFTLSACAAGSGEAAHAAHSGVIGQLLLGVWHGIIAPLTLIAEIINRLAPGLLPWSARVYEVRNTGVEYDIGFLLGLTGSPLIISRRWSNRT